MNPLRNVLLAWCLFALIFVIAGCREGAGGACLTDSNCKQGLVCLLRSQQVAGRTYAEKTGVCASDADSDGVGSDGDGSGSPIDARCGVQAVFDSETGEEQVREQVIGHCDDNCPEVRNSAHLTRFACAAQDSCCPLTEAERDRVQDFELCADHTDKSDTCSACQQGQAGSPTRCFLNFDDQGGFDIDDQGCLHCRPLQRQVACQLTADTDTCHTDAQLPSPACSGSWACVEGRCRFQPRLFPDPDDHGYLVLYQLDQDGDGLGDVCDNCPAVPNGIECRNPSFAYRCDVDGDSVSTPRELDLGEQRNQDGDMWGDACDLCPQLADDDNQDLDADGDGDACDPDDDGDGYCDPGKRSWLCTGIDNCARAANPDQRDRDRDSIGDACDPDQDGDLVREDGDASGVAGDRPCQPQTGPCCESPPCPVDEGFSCRDCDDNCPEDANPDQLDTDGDGQGDVCDLD